MLARWIWLLFSLVVLIASIAFVRENMDALLGVDDVALDDGTEGQLPDEDESTTQSEPGELEVSDERKAELPWLIWHGISPILETKGREITCQRGSCIVGSQTPKQAPMYLNDNTRALLMYGSGSKPDAAPLPRLKHHMWALLHEESPKNNAMYSHDAGISLFNFTSTFKQESNMPLTLQYLPNLQYLLAQPVPLEEKNQYRQQENGLASVAYVQSTCNNPAYRDAYVRRLMEHIQVDSLGKCLNNRQLPEELRNASEMFKDSFYSVLGRYKFIIAFENGICDDYITEKLWRPLHLGTVPIYRGAPNVNEWLPTPRSALVYDEFENPAALADYIKYLDSNDTAYMEYLEYKKGPEHITNEKLKSRLEDRPYSAGNFQENETLFLELSSQKQDFVTVFECKVCDRVVERMELERKHSEEGLPPPNPWIADSSHYGCPEPEEWQDEFAVGMDDPLDWKLDYEQGKRNAAALTRMILANESDASKLYSDTYY
ncbi:alpha-(1,3)-fucosyltransferase 11-like [Sycon ciliatum]|uniref:alpha-(1,3)-fucosyltransferase 11-like n=1 Tax=Sycon ciliatum TaxID=27933 RepID=UPI0031F6286E